MEEVYPGTSYTANRSSVFKGLGGGGIRVEGDGAPECHSCQSRILDQVSHFYTTETRDELATLFYEQGAAVRISKRTAARRCSLFGATPAVVRSCPRTLETVRKYTRAGLAAGSSAQDPHRTYASMHVHHI